MTLNPNTSATSGREIYDKSAPGRGYVVVIYGLYMGSVIAVVTAPVGALIAQLRLGRGAPWLDTHLLFQIRTFWIGVLAAGVALLLWRVVGLFGQSSIYAWLFGYLFFGSSRITGEGRTDL